MSISLDKMTARDALTLWSWKFNNTNAPLSCSAKDYYDLWNINNKWDYLVQSVLFCRLEVSGQSSGRKTQKSEWHIKSKEKESKIKTIKSTYSFWFHWRNIPNTAHFPTKVSIFREVPVQRRKWSHYKSNEKQNLGISPRLQKTKLKILAAKFMKQWQVYIPCRVFCNCFTKT